jgi:hypothetical protein
VEVTVRGKPGKRWCCFPSFPQTFETDEAGSHRRDDDEDELDPQNPAG